VKIATTAEWRENEWGLRGEKHFISGADQADYMLMVGPYVSPPTRQPHWSIAFYG